MDVASQMFSSMEYEDVAIDELCRQADVAKGLVFYYFADKRGLFAAVVEEAWQELAMATATREGEESAMDRLHGYLRRHLEWVEANPQRFTTLMANAPSSPDVRESIVTARRNAMSAITASLGCPENPPPRLRQAVRGWGHFVDDISRDWVAHRDVSTDDMIDICAQVLVAAVRSANGIPLDHEAELGALTQVVHRRTTSAKPLQAAKKDSPGKPAPQARRHRKIVDAPKRARATA